MSICLWMKELPGGFWKTFPSPLAQPRATVTLECSVPGRKPQGCGEVEGREGMVGPRSGRVPGQGGDWQLHSFILLFTQQIPSICPGWPRAGPRPGALPSCLVRRYR